VIDKIFFRNITKNEFELNLVLPGHFLKSNSIGSKKKNKLKPLLNFTNSLLKQNIRFDEKHVRLYTNLKYHIVTNFSHTQKLTASTFS